MTNALYGALLAAATAGPPAARQPAPASSWVWPVQPPVVTRGFSPPATPYGPGHRGVDLAAVAGQPVAAAGAGVVSFAGQVGGVGVVVVRHGPLRTTYEPVSATVAAGQVVAAGAVLGHVTGGHLGCTVCLHFGLRRGTVYLDPLSLFGRGPVRLLPVDGPPIDAVGPAEAVPPPGVTSLVAHPPAGPAQAASHVGAGGSSGPAGAAGEVVVSAAAVAARRARRRRAVG